MLDHENIVKIYDVVVTDKEKYLVMKYIEGETLRSYMDRMGLCLLKRPWTFLPRF